MLWAGCKPDMETHVYSRCRRRKAIQAGWDSLNTPPRPIAGQHLVHTSLTDRCTSQPRSPKVKKVAFSSDVTVHVIPDTGSQTVEGGLDDDAVEGERCA